MRKCTACSCAGNLDAGAWGGPVTALGVSALAGGGGVLLMTVIEPRMRRS